MEKKTVAVLFGGQSSEHVVSCMSAANIVEQIDTDTYNLLLIGITEEITDKLLEVRVDMEPIFRKKL